MQITLTERIGSGGNGTVYRGIDKDLNRDVAVKFFDNSFDSVRTQVVQHTMALKAIVHQNVVAIHGVALLRRLEHEPDGPEETALVMEFVPGTSFGAWLAVPGKTVADLHRVALGILAGVEAFHNKGLAHGDLHAGNVHVSDGEAKILDPMEHDPQSVRTSTLNALQQARDVRSARDLLIWAARDLGLSRECMEILTDLNDAPKTIPELRARFEAAIKEAGEPGTSLDPLITFYRECRAAQEHGNRVKWQELSKQAFRVLGVQMERWRASNPDLSDDADRRHQQIHTALRAIGFIWTWALASAELGWESSHRDVRELDRILTANWPQSGNIPYVNVPESLMYCAAYFVGASATLYGDVTTVMELANFKPSLRYNEELTPFWRRHEVSGWPRAIDHSADESWRFLNGCFGAHAVLRAGFSTEADFRLGLLGFNFVLCLHALTSMSPEEYERNTVNGELRVRMAVPPHWLGANRNELSRLWRLVTASQFMSKVAVGSRLGVENVRALWPKWVRASAVSWRDSRHPFFGDHVPDWVMTTPPI